VTICRGQGLFLRADDAGVLVRNFYGRTRRIAWTEISHFADGSYMKEGVTGWQLFIVLRAGKRVRVTSSVLAPPGEVVAAVREAARPHGIPADLSGIPAKRDGRPASRGLYHDPGGRAGLRYWDGRQWSPLLPPGVSKWWSRTVLDSPRSWAALPTADGRWTYAAAHATRETVVFAVAAVASAALLAGGLVAELWWDRGTHHRHMSGWGFWVFGGLAALYAFGAWRNRRSFLKLDEAANGSAWVATGWRSPADMGEARDDARDQS
jgi:hypothetical protein